MKTKLFASFTTALALTGAFASSAQAVGFNFTTNYTGNNSKGDIWLNSVTLKNGQTVSNFSVAKSVNILSNDQWTEGNNGGASADTGDNATTGVVVEDLTPEAALANLGNLNLNNIIDTENKGSFVIDVMLEQGVNNLLAFERGMNSIMDLQALDAEGNVIGSLLNLKSKNWSDAGFNINTMEIGGSQNVGSIGLSLADFDLNADELIFGYRVTALASYKGPDWKILGATAPTSVPEPTAVIGLGLVAGSFVASRRRQKS